MEEGTDPARARSYMEAMHVNCVKCHEEEAEIQDRPTLRDCETCHRSLTPLERLESGMAVDNSFGAAPGSNRDLAGR
jgi:hypothetical protein